MALAATENANVCTSVRNKYFTVELTSPEYGAVFCRGPGVVKMEVGLATLSSNVIRDLHEIG